MATRSPKPKPRKTRSSGSSSNPNESDGDGISSEFMQLEDNFEFKGKGTNIDDFAVSILDDDVDPSSSSSSFKLKNLSSDQVKPLDVEIDLDGMVENDHMFMGNVSFFRFIAQTFSAVLGINFMGYSEMMLVKKNSINVHPVRSKEEILSLFKSHPAGKPFMSVDPLNYDISQEAKAPLKFSFVVFFEDFFISLFSPFSFLYVRFKYGYEGLQTRHITYMITGVYPKMECPYEHDPQPSQVQLRAEAYNFMSIVFSVCKVSLAIGLCFGTYGFMNNQSIDRGNHTSCPDYYLFLFVLIYLMYCILLANKKALRSKESETRLLLAREKRNEELLNGWIPLPWWVAVFELRIAAKKVGLDLNQKIYFKESEALLREAIGSKVLNILESSPSQVPPINTQTKVKHQFQDSQQSVDVEEAGDAGSGLNEFPSKHVYDESNGSSGGSSCTIMSLLLHGCLEQSYAHPVHGKDATLPYGTANLSLTWLAVVAFVAVSPLLVDRILKPNAVWDGWDILICSTVLPFCLILNLAPQVFIFSAIISVRRKGRLQCFLNNILDPNQHLNHYSKWRSKFPYAMDFNHASNFNCWAKMRACLLKFGYRYKQRTDVNGGIIISILALVAAVFIVFTSVSTSKIYIWDIFFYAVIHLLFVFSVGSFAVKLALEGDECEAFCMKTKVVLSNAVLKFQDEHDMLQRKQKPKVNGGDLTNKYPDNKGGTWQADEKAVDINAIRNNALLLHEILAASEVLDLNMAMSVIEMNKATVTTILLVCFTQITLLLENSTFIKQ